MKFPSPLIDGILLKRYKRFLADVELPSGEKVLVHVPNSGSMKGVSDPGSPCRISRSLNPGRKIPYTLEMVKTVSDQWVGVNTSLTNALVHEAFQFKKIKEWKKFEGAQREVRIHELSRLDFLLTSKNQKHFVEVKNVSMAEPPYAVFPDAQTERGQKHLRDLLKLSKDGHGAEIFFVVQREDCSHFRPADEIDPVYAKLLRNVTKENVVARCWACRLTPTSIEIDRPLVIDLS